MPSKPYNQFPYDPGMGDQAKQCLDYMLQQLNQLVGQANTPPGSKLQTFGPNIIDPTSPQINSAGSRTASLTTSITFTTTTTSVSFFWDGSNGSQPFQMFRDDGTVVGPFITGSGVTIAGLTPSTTYFVYFYWDESVSQIKFSIIPDVGVGTPAAAFTTLNFQAAQIQILRGHVPLAPSLSSTGFATPGAGTGSGSGGGGGGAGGGQFCPLSGAPVKLYGEPEWWTKSEKRQEHFIEVTTETGRKGIFSPTHMGFLRSGLAPLCAWKVGEWALTEDGEELVTSLEHRYIPDGKVDRYEAERGHIYSAWGFLCHNVKLR